MGKKILLILMIILYAGAGINHFINPHFYIPIIPPYLPYSCFLNYAAGVSEFVLACMLIPAKTRNLACSLIILMLIVFIPVHIYMIQLAAIKPGMYSMKWWIVVLRLVLGQALLILWAYRVGIKS